MFLYGTFTNSCHVPAVNLLMLCNDIDIWRILKLKLREVLIPVFATHAGYKFKVFLTSAVLHSLYLPILLRGRHSSAAVILLTYVSLTMSNTSFIVHHCSPVRSPCGSVIFLVLG